MNNLYMQLGDLALTKLAGEIDNDEFEYQAMSMVKQAGAGKTLKELGKAYIDALTMKDARAALNPSRIRGWVHGGKYNYGDVVSAAAKAVAAGAPTAYAAVKLNDALKDMRGGADIRVKYEGDGPAARVIHEGALPIRKVK